MIIKKYIVNSMNEAMIKIRQELGKDAVIISQRKLRRTGIKGFFSKKLIEVTAAVDDVAVTKSVQEGIDAIKGIIDKGQNNSFQNADSRKFKNNDLKNETNREENSIINKAKSNVQTNVKSDKEDDLMKEIKEMKALISNIKVDNKEENMSEELKNIKKLLEENDYSHYIIDDIINKLKDFKGNELKEKLKFEIEKLILVQRPKTEGRIVLVGPTGVGKTTTIAKLAGKLALIDNKKVGLITIDTYRIGAVEQLKTYAEIMNIPFKVVYSIKEMEGALEEFSSCDVVLIDTTGRSSKNKMQLSELRAYVQKANTDNVNLVISSTTKNTDLDLIINSYKELGYKSLIITKLDETSTYGSIINIINKAQVPVTYMTVGQSVPEDIIECEKEKLYSLVMGEENIC